MMANRFRGEVDYGPENARLKFCLTLNALAEIEDALNLDSFSVLLERFQAGDIRARDVKALLRACLCNGQGPANAQIADIPPAQALELAIAIITRAFSDEA